MRKFTMLALAAILVTAGCTPGEEAPAPSPSPSVTPSPSPASSPEPEPSPSPTATTEPPPAALDCPGWDDGLDESGLAAIDFHRYAGICIGMSFAEASATYAGPPLTGHDYCPWVAPIVDIPEIGLYISAISYPEAPGEEIWLFRMMFLEDPAVAPDYEMPTTSKGATIGAMEGDIGSWYEGGSLITFEDYARGMRTQWVAYGPGGNSMTFDLVGGIVTEMAWGQNIAAGGPIGEICAL